MAWRTSEGKVIEKRRVAVWEALCRSMAARHHLGKDDWCEKWQELDSNLAHGIGHQLADELLCIAGLERIDN